MTSLAKCICEPVGEKQIANLRAIADPAAREHAARAAVESVRRLVAECAAVRAQAILELRRERGWSWREVGESLSPPVSAQAAWDIAHQRKR